MKKQLLPYKIGLAVIGVFTIALLVVVLMQANLAKQDARLYDDASEIADQLNDYIDDEQEIPESLSDAGINDVPDAVSYRTIEDGEKYEFCVTYKADNGGLDAEDVGSEILYGEAYSYDEYYGEDDEAAYLYLDYSHKKGKNCQVIWPYLDSASSYEEGDDPYAICDEQYDNSPQDKQAEDAYYDCLDKVDAAESTRVD